MWKDGDKREGIHLISLPFTSFYFTIAEGRREKVQGWNLVFRLSSADLTPCSQQEPKFGKRLLAVPLLGLMARVLGKSTSPPWQGGRGHNREEGKVIETPSSSEKQGIKTSSSSSLLLCDTD